MIHFERLQRKHFALMLKWFNEPHVQAFYSLREWTLEEVEKKLSPYIDGNVRGYLIISEEPLGYIQCYPIRLYPWENQTLEEKIIARGAGLDLFIGEKKYLGLGLGKDIIACFLDQILWKEYDFCVVDPDVKNTKSIRLFESCGFKAHQDIISKNALDQRATLRLFVKEKFGNK